jgi:hypothetical protein
MDYPGVIRRRLPRRRSAAAVAMLVSASIGAPNAALGGPVIGQYELKTLDSAPGAFEFQSQNAWSWGEPPRQVAVTGPGEFVVDDNDIIRARYALELEIGITHYFKTRIGIEFEQERLGDPPTLEQANDFDDLKLADAGIEFIGILIPRVGDGAGLGVVAEFEGPPDHAQPNNFTLGPIVEFQSGPWFAAAVPMLVHQFGGHVEPGEKVDDKWDFAYAAQLTYRFSLVWALAVEGYGTVERIGDSGIPSQAARLFGDFDQHRIGAVLYYSHEFAGAAWVAAGPASAALSDADDRVEGRSLTVGFGLLEGLNNDTPDHTIKLSIEVHF